jgi:hypothetical protein
MTLCDFLGPLLEVGSALLLQAQTFATDPDKLPRPRTYIQQS